MILNFCVHSLSLCGVSPLSLLSLPSSLESRLCDCVSARARRGGRRPRGLTTSTAASAVPRAGRVVRVCRVTPSS
jgi:hypothetical protein